MVGNSVLDGAHINLTDPVIRHSKT